MVGYKRNVKELKNLLGLAPDANKDKIQTIIRLYDEEKRITNFKTALNAVTALANSRVNVQAKGNRLYNNIIDKYVEAPKRKTSTVIRTELN